MQNIFITVNSPGEIEGWLKPLVKKIKSIKKEVYITVFIPPCRFSSGYEEEVIKNINEIDLIVKKKDFIGFVLGYKKIATVCRKEKGVVVFLGGDIFYSLLLKWKMGWPAIAYTYTSKPWPWHKLFNKFYTKRDIGNLMVDSFSDDFEENKTDINILKSKNKKILFFPGSREKHFRAFLPFLIKTANHIKVKKNDLCLFIKISPFINSKVREDIFKLYDLSEFILINDDTENYLNYMDLLVSLPGTNTAQAAVKQIPMLVTLPFNWPELIDYDGIVGLISNTPLLGKYIKKVVLHIANRYIKYIALPNMESDEMIVPEIRRIITEEELAEEIISIINDDNKLLTMKNKLKGVMGKIGAVDIICQDILNLVEVG